MSWRIKRIATSGIDIKRNASRNMVVDKYYMVIGLSGAQIVMNGTISTSQGVSFFNRILSTSAQRPRDERWDGTARGGRESTEYLPTIIIAACVMYHVILQATMVAHTHTHTHTHTRARARAYKYTYEISRNLLSWEKQYRSLDAVDARTRLCISWRFGCAGHYRYRNKSKSREQAWRPFAIRRRERESFINLCANVFPTGLMSSSTFAMGGPSRSGYRGKWESRDSPLIFESRNSDLNRTGDKMEITGESILRFRSW